MLGIPILMTDNENPNVSVHMPIDDRIGKPGERERAPVFPCWFTDLGKLFK